MVQLVLTHPRLCAAQVVASMLGQTFAWAVAMAPLYPLTHALPMQFGRCLRAAMVWGPLGKLQPLLQLCIRKGARLACTVCDF